MCKLYVHNLSDGSRIDTLPLEVGDRLGILREEGAHRGMCIIYQADPDSVHYHWKWGPSQDTQGRRSTLRYVYNLLDLDSLLLEVGTISGYSRKKEHTEVCV